MNVLEEEKCMSTSGHCIVLRVWVCEGLSPSIEKAMGEDLIEVISEEDQNFDSVCLGKLIKVTYEIVESFCEKVESPKLLTFPRAVEEKGD